MKTLKTIILSNRKFSNLVSPFTIIQPMATISNHLAFSSIGWVMLGGESKNGERKD